MLWLSRHDREGLVSVRRNLLWRSNQRCDWGQELSSQLSAVQLVRLQKECHMFEFATGSGDRRRRSVRWLCFFVHFDEKVSQRHGQNVCEQLQRLRFVLLYQARQTEADTASDSNACLAVSLCAVQASPGAQEDSFAGQKMKKKFTNIITQF